MNHRNEVEPNDTDWLMLILSPKLNQIVNHMIYLFIIEIEFPKTQNYHYNKHLVKSNQYPFHYNSTSINYCTYNEPQR